MLILQEYCVKLGKVWISQRLTQISTDAYLAYEEKMMTNQIPPNVVEMILDMLKKLNESDEFFDVVASMMKKLYDALLREGFTEDQAAQIVAGFAAKGNK
jgi:hypothetical protein